MSDIKLGNEAGSVAPFLRGSQILRNFCCLALVSLALSACILVDDFSGQWQKGKTDFCINKIAESLYYSEFRRDPEGKDITQLAHLFPLGDFYFLMLKKNPEDKGGRMYRFGLVRGKEYNIFQRYRLDPTMRTTFEHDYPKAPVSLAHDTVNLATLGKAELTLLADISAKGEYWQIEDQTLYNTSHNPLCTLAGPVEETHTNTPSKDKK